MSSETYESDKSVLVLVILFKVYEYWNGDNILLKLISLNTQTDFK